MPSDSPATWTSGEPVSFFLVAYSAITSFLRSGVIIGHRFLKLKNTERAKFAFGDFGQCHGIVPFVREENGLARKSILVGHSLFQPGEEIRADQDGIAASKADRIAARYGQRRDAVQRGRKGI